MGESAKLARWLLREGRFLAGNLELLEKFCERLEQSGISLARCWLHIRALHPEFGGVSRLWKRGAGIEERFHEHGFEQTLAYLESPIRFVVERGERHDWRLDTSEAPFPLLSELRAAGYLHYAIAPLVYSDGTSNAISWATDRGGGFSPDDLRLFDEILPSLAAVAEAKSLRRFASSMLTTYVGREPGQLILKGQIRRGEVRTITAALMLVDLRDFTALSDALEPDRVIETLNRYFDCIMPPVTRRRGEVMKIMGDGILAIFNDGLQRSSEEACRLAFDATCEASAALEESNRTASPGSPQLRAGFALHYGEVSYGNIGSADRLDFTVIGPDVNLTSRIERLCRELDRAVIMSSAFAGRLDRAMLEIGHFALRGFSQMQLLLGLPEASASAGQGPS